MERGAIAGFLQAVPVPLIAVDGAARVIGASPAATALLGLRGEMAGARLPGRPFVTLLRHPQVNDALEAVLDPARTPAAEAGLVSLPGGEVRLRAVLASAGRDIACEIMVSPLGPAGPGGGGALVSIQDLTALEQVEAMRRDFVANVSHELRTPLTALMGFIETLRGPARNDAAARDRFLEIMAREAGRMNRLVSDLLSLSRVEGEERRRPEGTVDLAALIRATAATLAPTASAAGATLAIEGVEAPVRIAGDADQIVQVLHNLIENAVKYGGGAVRVSVRRVAHEPVLRGPGWALEVADSGPGIEPRHLSRLTERFYRVDSHRSRAQGGTGLGLAIVKHIVNRHRGRLKIESAPGQGSRFTVILPDAAP